MLELVTKRDNFVKKNKINCIYCKSENVVSEGRQQYYCKNCEKYFKPGSKRAEYSKNVGLVLKAVHSLLFPASNKKKLKIRDYYKAIKDKINPIYHNAQLRYVTIPSLTDPTNATSVNIDASVKNAVVLIREGSGFVVVNGLSVRKKIHFNDYDITVSSPEPIKRDYDFYEEEQLRRVRYRN